MEPAHRSALTRVAEGLQLVVPGGSEELGDRDTQRLRTERVGEERGLEPTFRHDDVAGEAGLGAEQPEPGRVADAAALREGRGLFGCLLYTSDAADDLTRVDLCGRRLIK